MQKKSIVLARLVQLQLSDALDVPHVAADEGEIGGQAPRGDQQIHTLVAPLAHLDFEHIRGHSDTRNFGNPFEHRGLLCLQLSKAS
jgi:hypothetical protein